MGITEHDRRLMVPVSDVFSPSGRTKTQVVSDLSVTRINDQRCEYTDRVTATATDEFLNFMEGPGFTHNRRAASNYDQTETRTQS